MLSLQKIYDVVRNHTVDAIVRVASPAFPKDKLESEVISFRPPFTAQSRRRDLRSPQFDT